MPTIIAGDFNASPEAASIRYLTGLQPVGGHSVHYHDAWAIAGNGPGYTWTTDNPAASAESGHIVGQPGHRRRLDYVFTGSWHAPPGPTAASAPSALPSTSPSAEPGPVTTTVSSPTRR